jgi:hypothetical protein
MTDNYEFDKIFFGIGNSLLGYKKSLNLYNEVNLVKDLSGNTCEVGVFQGITSKLIHTMLPDRVHYAYDTYSGITGSNQSIDIHTDGEFACSLYEVQNNINMPNVVYKVGMFPDTFNEQSEQFVFVHSDTDTYMGTSETLRCFSPLMVCGGKIMFDDYQWKNCPGVEKAIKEFLATNDDFIVKEYNNNYTCPHDNTYINQCVLTKK